MNTCHTLARSSVNMRWLETLQNREHLHFRWQEICREQRDERWCNLSRSPEPPQLSAYDQRKPSDPMPCLLPSTGGVARWDEMRWDEMMRSLSAGPPGERSWMRQWQSNMLHFSTLLRSQFVGILKAGATRQTRRKKNFTPTIQIAVCVLQVSWINEFLARWSGKGK